MGNLDFIIDEMHWSFSRLECYERCPLCFYYDYILKKESVDGAFGQYGLFGHELLEKYFKGELFDFELAEEFTDKYTQKVTAYFPPMKNGDMSKRYFEQGYEYFKNFNGLDNKYKILGVEQKYKFKLEQYDFVGILDLELMDNEGIYYIVDHKSKSKQDQTRVTKKKNIEDFVQLIDNRYIPISLAMQLYIYCIPFKGKYGVYPEYLKFNMFKIQDWYTLKFDKNDFERSKQWAINQIDNIYNETQWLKGKDVSGFWCDFVCSNNVYCKHSSKYMGVD